MRLFVFFSLIISSFNIQAQLLEYNIDWNGNTQYELEQKKVSVPQVKNFNTNYSFNQSYSLVKQWKDNQIIDANSVKIVRAEFSEININNFSGLEKIKFPNKIEFQLNSSISKTGLSNPSASNSKILGKYFEREDPYAPEVYKAKVEPIKSISSMKSSFDIFFAEALNVILVPFRACLSRISAPVCQASQ